MKTDFIFILFLIFWLIAFNKKFLFWVYLWQLKEYHFGRFFAHFETRKGKNLIFDKLLLLKMLFVLGIALNFQFSRIPLLLLFFTESVLAFNHFRKRTLKKPVLTSKIIAIISTGFLFQILIISHLLEAYDSARLTVLILLFLDIFIVLFSSFCVFLWHPLSYLWRLKIIKEAKRKREKLKNLLVIGITGSYGKTSTKAILTLILSKKYKVLETKFHLNSEVGISRCILKYLKPEHEIFVCEMGAYNKGGIKLLSEIAKPKMGILTGINEQHMATFGSKENIIKTKFELLEALPEDGVAVLNWESPPIRNYFESKKANLKHSFSKEHFKSKIIKYSLSKDGDISVKNIRTEKEYISFDLLSKNDSIFFKVNLPGSHNVLNLLGAVLTAREVGMSLKEISEACKDITFGLSGMNLIKRQGGLNVADASYSANPNGVISHLNYLKTWQGKKIIIMPCLIELGNSSNKIHEEIGKKIGEVCDLAIITTEDRFENIKKGWQDTARNSSEIIFEDNPRTILEKIRIFTKENENPENIILLESRIPKKVTEVLTS